MPIFGKDVPTLSQVVKETERFGALLKKVPVVYGARSSHPAVRPMLRSFRSINRALASRDRRGYVSVAQQARIGREFKKIGAAFQDPRIARLKLKATRRPAGKTR